MTESSSAAVRQGRTRVWLWTVVAALAVGVVVAALGARAGIAAYQRDQAIGNYAHARSAATYFVKHGATISASMKRLQTLDEQDVALMRAQRAALVAGNTTAFNSLTSSANNRNEQQQALHHQVHKYQIAFDKLAPSSG